MRVHDVDTAHLCAIYEIVSEISEAITEEFEEDELDEDEINLLQYEQVAWVSLFAVVAAECGFLAEQAEDLVCLTLDVENPHSFYTPKKVK